ncbi:MAG TPA: ABC transporter ATP-binding protein [Dehalococcoidia bacterium]|nr:ABC transporter ATP-binding protein [Dehalococcoidia bacterium]
MTRGWVRCQLGEFSLETEWEAAPGQVLILFGPSGAGKTTTLRAIAGLVRPLQGHIEVGGQVVYDSQSRSWVPPHRRRVGYLTQQVNLFPHLSVIGNLRYGLAKRGLASRSATGYPLPMERLLQNLQLEGLEERRVWELSGGQQQRVALARALATDPQVLLLDEPFSSLDAELRRALRDEVRSILSRANIPVILVTHDRDEALAMGDVIQVIDRGRTLSRGEPLQVLGQPGQARVARLVGVENILAMRVASRHPQDGTMVCVSREGPTGPEAGLHLEVPLSDLAEGQPVTVGIRASDIILAGEKLVSSSARNQIRGKVVGVELRPPGYEVTLDCAGIQFHCHITGTSLSEMKVAAGLDLWAVFKASSCFLVKEDPVLIVQQ